MHFLHYCHKCFNSILCICLLSIIWVYSLQKPTVAKPELRCLSLSVLCHKYVQTQSHSSGDSLEGKLFPSPSYSVHLLTCLSLHWVLIFPPHEFPPEPYEISFQYFACCIFDQICQPQLLSSPESASQIF